MPLFSSHDDGCKARAFSANAFSHLGQFCSSFSLSSALAKLSAASLVSASAGLGAVYAWQTGSAHGTVLAMLFVMFAVGLELAKPLAVVTTLKALQSWSLVRGTALAVLALMAITYSLTAELTLMAGTRGDVVAQRQAALDASSATQADLKRARERYEAAKAELATLAPTQPSASLQAEIDGLLLTPGSEGCTTINGKVTREVCPKVAALKVEKARAERREVLAATLAKPLPVAITPHRSQVKEADPGASALATYLAAIGIVLPATVLTDWLALVPVLALEIGSALAGVLVQAVSGPKQVAVGQIRRCEDVKEPIQRDATTEVGQVGHAKETAPSGDAGQEGERVKRAILTKLEEQGEVEGSQRGLAALIGTSRPTVRRAINALMLAGVIAAEATRNGTVLRLVA